MLKEYYGIHTQHQVDLSNNSIKNIETYFKKIAPDKEQAIKMTNVFLEKAIYDNVDLKTLYDTIINTPDVEIKSIYEQMCDELSSSTAVIGDRITVPSDLYENRNVVF